MGKTFEVFKLQLPAINLPSLKVIFEDHRTFASPTAVSRLVASFGLTVYFILVAFVRFSRLVDGLIMV